MFLFIIANRSSVVNTCYLYCFGCDESTFEVLTKY